MAFATATGKTRIEKCSHCGVETTFEEHEFLDRQGHHLSWIPAPHRAPCGAHCAAGSYEHGDPDVHIPFRGVCPRCGAREKEHSDA